jgi:hypothetical protein
MTEIETALADNRAAVGEFLATARGLDDARWTTPRAPAAWAPGQIVEHLARAYEYSADVVKGTATGGAAPRLLRPLLRRFIVDATLKAGKFTRKGRAPAMFQPAATPGTRHELLPRLEAALTAFEGAIRSGHPEARHDVMHPFFGKVPTTRYVRMQAIHARHHRDQLTST